MSIDQEMEEILQLFFEESFEGLDTMESGLLTLDNSANRETINTIFRAAHSIKGGAGTFGFMEISGFTHSVETLLDEMRNGTRGITPDALQVLLQSVDVIREMVQSAQAKRPIDMVGATALSSELIRILAQKGAPVNSAAESAASSPPAAAAPPPAIDAPATSASAAPDRSDVSEAAAASKSAAIAVNGNLPGGVLEGWRIVFEPDLSLLKTCNDPLRIFDELANLGTLEVEAHTAKIPPFGELDPTQCFLSWTLCLRSPAEHARVAEVFDWVDANSKIVYEPIYGAGVSAGVPSLPAAELPQAGGQRSMTAADVPAVQPVPAKSGGESGSLRVATEKVDALINLVGELVITQSMLGRFAEKYEPQDIESLRRSLAQLTRNTRELQESVLQIRMLPIGFSFNRFPRLVHDLSRKLGKKVDLKLSGENTELDKTVLEKISDPLVHLVRNALDHGLESPEARLAAGKSDTGTLELNAFHEGGSIVIEVRDDGAGLNKDRILAKARERGLVDADALLSDENIYNLIFVAGFSTADTVSDVSGRGVGMDVVRRNINDLGGHVQILSVPGRGSTIRIRLPLTLAILEGQMLRVGKEIYVASLVSIIETVQSKGEDISCVAGRTELFKHRSDYLPIIRLYDLFGIEPDSRDITDGLLVVLEADGRRVAMLVDELLAQQQVVIKSLETNFKQVPGLAGATIHGDGTVALILDVPGLVRTFLERQSMQFGRAA
ncbi:MAG TPA: chemotaxis protein CheA [Steroidobacteraceae bacterium]|nr:chemotaxis protein CheA [Steroidobacteraceae bacterium]